MNQYNVCANSLSHCTVSYTTVKKYDLAEVAEENEFYFSKSERCWIKKYHCKYTTPKGLLKLK